MFWINLYEALCMIFEATFFAAVIVNLSQNRRFYSYSTNISVAILVIELANVYKMIFAMNDSYFETDMKAFVASSICYLLAIFIVCKDDIKNKLKLIFLVIFVPYAGIVVPIQLIIRKLIAPDKSFEYVANNPVIINAARMMSITTCIVYCSAVLIFNNKNIKKFRVISVLFLTIIPVMQSITSFILVRPDVVLKPMLAASLGGLSLFLASMLGFLFMRYMITLNKIYEKKIENEVYESNRQMYFQYFDLVKREVDRTNKIKHDIGNQIEQIEYLIASENASDRDIAEKMLLELKQKTNEYTKLSYCENPILNTILSIKGHYAENNGIKFSPRIELPSDVDISPLVLSSVVSNMIDNGIKSAIRAKENCEDVYLKYKISGKNDFIYFKMENSTATTEKIIDIDIAIERSYSMNNDHGYGLRIMQDIAKRNNGDLYFEIDKQICTTILTMKYNKGEVQK